MCGLSSRKLLFQLEKFGCLLVAGRSEALSIVTMSFGQRLPLLSFGGSPFLMDINIFKHLDMMQLSLDALQDRVPTLHIAPVAFLTLLLQIAAAFPVPPLHVEFSRRIRRVIGTWVYALIPPLSS